MMVVVSSASIFASRMNLDDFPLFLFLLLLLFPRENNNKKMKTRKKEKNNAELMFGWQTPVNH
jgi:hypothetical protein